MHYLQIPCYTYFFVDYVVRCDFGFYFVLRIAWMIRFISDTLQIHIWMNEYKYEGQMFIIRGRPSLHFRTFSYCNNLIACVHDLHTMTTIMSSTSAHPCFSPIYYQTKCRNSLSLYFMIGINIESPQLLPYF